jgi:hypothetical protein
MNKHYFCLARLMQGINNQQEDITANKFCNDLHEKSNKIKDNFRNFTIIITTDAQGNFNYTRGKTAFHKKRSFEISRI